MVSFGEKAKIKKAGYLNQSCSYVITTVPQYRYISQSDLIFSNQKQKAKLNQIVKIIRHLPIFMLFTLALLPIRVDYSTGYMREIIKVS